MFSNFTMGLWFMDYSSISFFNSKLTVTVKVNVAQSFPTLYDPMDCSLPGSSVHGIFQVRILEQVTIFFSRRSSQPRDQTQVSRIIGRRFTVWATREVRLTEIVYYSLSYFSVYGQRIYISILKLLFYMNVLLVTEKWLLLSICLFSMLLCKLFSYTY